MVKQNGLENCFYIMGRKNNPYPYINGADIYVQPSRHEGYGITIAEAKALRKIIVCTNFAGADEQIVDGLNGVIVKTFEPEHIADAIFRICSDECEKKKINAGIEKFVQESTWKAISNILL